LDGLLFTYEDPESLAQAILYLLGHPQERAKMGNAGLKKVMENYTWEIVADRIRDVYTKVINLKNDFD
ncbi:MAG: glycosyltransferase, partial [Aliifodinibius sp.]|nr:glycosyltransferase family 4 protein [Fodinibius sp.]NIV14552.1 glycosyltransferase [Fodinibius sp.]NIY28398.1 glycosyltransferase [Fodinibius sp.]